MPAQSASQASSTPDKPHNEDRKRKRDVLSCLDCRRRKLKCDRSYPACNRCVKGGNASSCTYQTFPGNGDARQEELDASAEEDGKAHKRARSFHDAHPTNGAGSVKEVVPGNYTSSGTESMAQSNMIKSLEHRLATLESMLSKNSSTGIFQQESLRSAVTTPSKLNSRGDTEPESHIFKGRGVRTQFYGPSNPTSLLAHVRDLDLVLDLGSLLMNTSFARSEYS